MVSKREVFHEETLQKKVILHTRPFLYKDPLSVITTCMSILVTSTPICQAITGSLWLFHPLREDLNGTSSFLRNELTHIFGTVSWDVSDRHIHLVHFMDEICDHLILLIWQHRDDISFMDNRNHVGMLGWCLFRHTSCSLMEFTSVSSG